MRDTGSGRLYTRNSIRPLAPQGRTSNRLQATCDSAVSTAWITHSSGEINRKVNSIGSVMPTRIEVVMAGIRIALASIFFSGLAVW
ncbi:hypothetical protein D3C80_1789300 [compost metagenome]